MFLFPKHVDSSDQGQACGNNRSLLFWVEGHTDGGAKRDQAAPGGDFIQAFEEVADHFGQWVGLLSWTGAALAGVHGAEGWGCWATVEGVGSTM